MEIKEEKILVTVKTYPRRFFIKKILNLFYKKMVVCTLLPARQAISSFPSKYRFTGIFREITANLA